MVPKMFFYTSLTRPPMFCFSLISSTHLCLRLSVLSQAVVLDGSNIHDQWVDVSLHVPKENFKDYRLGRSSLPPFGSDVPEELVVVLTGLPFNLLEDEVCCWCMSLLLLVISFLWVRISCVYMCLYVCVLCVGIGVWSICANNRWKSAFVCGRCTWVRVLSRKQTTCCSSLVGVVADNMKRRQDIPGVYQEKNSVCVCARACVRVLCLTCGGGLPFGLFLRRREVCP